MEFREWMTAIAMLRGNAFAEIEDSPSGGYQLWPIHPDAVRVEYAGKGRRYMLMDMKTREWKETPGENIFHLAAFQGLSVVTLARETMGLTIAAERYAAKFFAQGQRPIGSIEMKEGSLSDDAYGRIRKQIDAWHGGWENAHRMLILEEGATWKQIGLSAQDSQFLETRKFQVEEICRWFRVPPHKIAHLERSTNNNIEQQAIEFVSDAILPWAVRWEQAIRRDLILNPDRFYAKHNLEGLLRGDVKTRFGAYAVGISHGILNPNECREIEDRNPRKDSEGDAFRRPLNSTTTANPASVPPTGQPGGDRPLPGKPKGEDRATLMAFAAAKLLAVRETRALKTGGDLAPFLAKHARSVEEALAVPPEKAMGYCADLATRYETDRDAVLSDEQGRIARLVVLWRTS